MTKHISKIFSIMLVGSAILMSGVPNAMAGTCFSYIYVHYHPGPGGKCKINSYNYDKATGTTKALSDGVWDYYITLKDCKDKVAKMNKMGGCDDPNNTSHNNPAGTGPGNQINGRGAAPTNN